MKARDAVIVVACGLAVTVPFEIMRAQEKSRAEAAAFGRGAIAGICRVLVDRHPDPMDRASALTASLDDCKPYLDELNRRTGVHS